MIQTNEQVLTTETRESLYLFLSRMYILEADMELIEAIRKIPLPMKVETESISEGFEKLQRMAELVTTDMLDDLAADYACLFLAAGKADGKAAFPYESVYTSQSRLLMQESENQVRAAYRKRHLIQGTGFPAVPEDHIAMEFYFMAILCREEIRFISEEDKESLAKVRMEQIHFYQEHLSSWLAYFCEDIAKYACTEFYQAVGLITKGFMDWEGTYGLHSQS